MKTATAEGPGKDEILEAIAGMTVLELNDLVKTIEEKFGVKAAPAAVPTAAAMEAPPEAEQTEFNVVLTSAGEKKIQVIKAVRELTNLGLKECKDLVEAIPKTLKEGLDKAQAEEWRSRLVEAGASVDLQ